MTAITEWIPFISGYPIWARVIVLICVVVGGSVLVLARKVEETKETTLGLPQIGNVNQQNAGTINNIFLGPPPPPFSPLGESTAMPNATLVPQDPRAIETLIDVIRTYKN